MALSMCQIFVILSVCLATIARAQRQLRPQMNPGSQPPRPGGQPPRPGGQPPRPGGQPPRPGGQPPRFGGQPPRFGGQPPRSGTPPPRSGTPPPRCTCRDDGKMTELEIKISQLMHRMDQYETNASDSIQKLYNLGQDYQQLLTSSTENKLRIQPLIQTNRQLRATNADLQSRLDRAATESRGDVDPGDTKTRNDCDTCSRSTRSSSSKGRSYVRELGNREAEMMEAGQFGKQPVDDGAEDEMPSLGHDADDSSSRQGPLSDEENVARSLLVLRVENAKFTRKVEELEARLNDHEPPKGNSVEGRPGRPACNACPGATTPGSSNQELAERVSQLERLMLVALKQTQALPDETAERQLTEPNRAISPGTIDSKPQQGGDGLRGDRVGGGGGDGNGRRRQRSLTETSDLTDEDLEALSGVVSRVRNNTQRKSAFSMASTNIFVGTDGDAARIEFDHQFVNKGGDFKRNQHRFVCDHTGFYFITFTVRSYDSKYLGVSLMKNDEIQTAVYADPSDRNVMQTQSILVHLTTGDRLWLRHAPSGNFAVDSGIHRYVTFSGFLIYKGY